MHIYAYFADEEKKAAPIVSIKIIMNGSEKEKEGEKERTLEKRNIKTKYGDRRKVH